jgi:hypothetical protein
MIAVVDCVTQTLRTASGPPASNPQFAHAADHASRRATNKWTCPLFFPQSAPSSPSCDDFAESREVPSQDDCSPEWLLPRPSPPLLPQILITRTVMMISMQMVPFIYAFFAFALFYGVALLFSEYSLHAIVVFLGGIIALEYMRAVLVRRIKSRGMGGRDQ